MDNDDRGMDIALALAEAALELGELAVGAAVMVDGNAVDKAHTRERTESRYLVHAELDALLDFDRSRPSFDDRRRAVLYTTVEPCLMCLGATMSAFVGGLVYSLDSKTDGAVHLVSSWACGGDGFVGYRMPTVKGGVRAVQSRGLFEAYLDKTAEGPMRRWASSLVGR